MTKLTLDSIRLDGGTQPRARLNDERVAEYAENLQAGVVFPPVEVCYDGHGYWLWDGFHRVHACRLLGLEGIDTNVTAGTQADAQWLSYSANSTHGLQRSNEDKRRAVLAALGHPRGASASDREIAQHVGVHFETVAKYRKGLEGAGTIGKSDSRTGRDGRTIKTARIGRKKSSGKSKPAGIASDAFKPVRGHSRPAPKTALELPHDPVFAARTLISVFGREFLVGLVSEITRFLEGDGQ